MPVMIFILFLLTYIKILVDPADLVIAMCDYS